MELTTSVSQASQFTVVSVSGEIDVYTAPRLREVLMEQTEAGNHQILLDLSDVEFLDSTGLGTLVGALKRTRDHDGTLALVSVPERILKVFRITGLTKVFQVYDDVDQASSAVAV